MTDLAKQKKIRGGHRAHAKKVIGEIQGILESDANENRYELEQLKDALIEKVDVLKALDDSVLKLMEDPKEIDEGEFGQELSDASDCQLKYRKVVHLAEIGS
jgi:hypothetical protein